MPNLVNRVLIDDFTKRFESAGSCLVVSFDKLTVEEVSDLRDKFREAGVQYQVVKNRIAVKAFGSMDLDLTEAFKGKCGVVVAPEETAISAAKIVREAVGKKKPAPLVVTGGVIEGEVITGPAAAGIADMPDKNTVRAQLLGAMSGVARGLAVCLQGAGTAGLARAIQARVDKEGGE